MGRVGGTVEPPRTRRRTVIKADPSGHERGATNRTRDVIVGKTFFLRHRTTIVDVGDKPVVIGRATDVELSIDDALMSRRHAQLEIISDRLWIRDLGSRNGTRVNGRHVEQSPLDSDDVVTIGSQEIHVLDARPGSQTRTRERRDTVRRDVFGDDSTSIHHSPWFEVERLLTIGDTKTAQRRIVEQLHGVLVSLANGKLGTASLIEATRYALRHASDTGNGMGIDWVFRAYDSANATLPTASIDEIHVVARKVRYKVGDAMKSYVDGLSSRAESLSASERFALQRVHGLLRTLLAA
jgi:pSer/pThr/pTyr-binding forkhead associated (FHA) protein